MNYLRSIKKIMLFALVLVFSMGIASKVTSYSSATIESPVTLTITDSGKALISPRLSSWKVMQGETTKDTIRIVSNLSEDIVDLDVWFDLNEKDVTIADIKGECVKSGESALLDVEISAAVDAEPRTVDVDVVFYAKWGGGEAEIETTGELEIVENPELLLLEEQQILQLSPDVFSGLEKEHEPNLPEKVIEDLNSREGISTDQDNLTPNDDVTPENLNPVNSNSQDPGGDKQKDDDELSNDVEIEPEKQDINESPEAETGESKTDETETGPVDDSENDTQEKVSNKTEPTEKEEVEKQNIKAEKPETEPPASEKKDTETETPKSEESLAESRESGSTDIQEKDTTHQQTNID